MRTVKIIHAADMHLDSPFQSLGERAQERRGEQRGLLEKIAAVTNEREADMLLLAGDLLDTSVAYAETADALRRALQAVKCPVFIAPGNHDYYSAVSPYARMELPENVHIFKSGAMEKVELACADVYGAAFGDISCPPRLRGFRAPRREGVVNIGVLHGEVGKPDSRYNPMTEQEIADSGLDYLALGHVHSRSGLQRAGDTFYAYPGCTEGRGFDECGEKGLLVLELGEGTCREEFIPLDGRRYEIVSFSPADLSGISIPARAKRDIYRIILTGETDRAPDTEQYYNLLKSRFYHLEIVDNTRISRDIWERAEQDTLRGLFLRKMRQRYDSAQDEQERRQITDAVRWCLAALDGGEAVKSL